MDPGDRAEACPPLDVDLKFLCIAYIFLWIPIGLAVPFSIATYAVARLVYGVDMFLASQPGAGPYPWIDVLGLIAASCVLHCLLLWLATWVIGPIIVGLRIRRRIQGISTPGVFWLLVFGPLVACPIAYVGSMIFLSAH